MATRTAAETAKLRRETDWFALVDTLEADLARLKEERDIANQYAQTILQNREAEFAQLRREIAGLRASHELQTRATLGFRRDFLEWKARAEGLERLLQEEMAKGRAP